MEFSSQKIFKNNQIQKKNRANKRNKLHTMITLYFPMVAMKNNF